MARRRAFQEALMDGRHDNSLRFRDMQTYLRALGFDERIRGDHHIYSKGGMPELLNLQPRGGHCKRYQVRQVRKLLGEYGLRL